jgi:fructokinase
MSTTPVKILGLGEILWDLLPGGRQPGGAPFNFAFHAHQLGQSAAIVSRIGQDDLGREIRDVVCRLGLPDTFLQEDDSHPTGTVQVEVDGRGQPAFTITPAVAWDHLAWEDALEPLVQKARAVCFGTLAQRHPASRATIRRVLDTADNALIVFDINLRQYYYGRAVIEESLNASAWAKLNEYELEVLRKLLDLQGDSPSALLAELRKRYFLELVALTRGERGCLVQSMEGECDLPGVPVQVVDTVGAGDAFTAGLLVRVLEGASHRQAAAFANRLAARVAAAAGGTPAIRREEIKT